LEERIMAKPRTNAQAAEFWADHILSREPAPYTEVNSIIIEGDAIYSFGRHYPMGRIIRREDGTVRRVVVTSSFYPSRGFADTPGDQSNVLMYARDACERARIKLERKPLSHYGNERIPALPRPDDPEPEQYPRTEVPPLFTPWGDPGPEPVKDSVGCVAGVREEYEYQEERYLSPLFPEGVFPQDFTVWHRYPLRDGDEGKSLYARRSHTGVIVWGEERSDWEHFNRLRTPIPTNVDYKQCPHCAAFDVVHDQWYVRMHGPRWGRGRDKGWALYSAMVHNYGSEEGWREARRQDVRRVREAKKVRAEWEERNLIPYDFIGRDADRIIILNDDGYARRIDGEAWRKRLRQQERARRQAERQQRETERMQRQIARLRERRERRKAKTFTGRAELVATNLARIADELSSDA
jgi:hypothetical protein